MTSNEEAWAESDARRAAAFARIKEQPTPLAKLKQFKAEFIPTGHLGGCPDEDEGHVIADEILLEVLKQHGEGEIVKAYKDVRDNVVGFWYS